MEEMDEYTNSLSNSSCPTESTYQPLEYLASTRGFKIASFNITSLVAHIDELKITMSDCIVSAFDHFNVKKRYIKSINYYYYYYYYYYS